MGRLARYAAGLLALAALALVTACGPAFERPAGPAGLAGLAPVTGHPDDLEVTRSRWIGIGKTDTCDLAWALDLLQEGDRVSGRFLWETVQYDLSGRLARDGSLRQARAGKNPDFNGTPAPRFVVLDLQFGRDRAIGSYAAETQGKGKCATAVELKRYSAE